MLDVEIGDIVDEMLLEEFNSFRENYLETRGVLISLAALTPDIMEACESLKKFSELLEEWIEKPEKFDV